MPRLPPSPDLEWDEAGAPRARAFDDVYFSRGGGFEETAAVFHAGCGLPEAWAGRDAFALGELGFGCGLNALATWALWARTRKPGAVLHYVSVEAFPLSREDAARALAAFPEIAPFAERLLRAWPIRAYGPQRLWFPDDGFALTLHIGEAASVLDGLAGKFDAWFLDGFAPARNPDLWTPALMARIAALSAPAARAATYSVAAAVRDALQGAGFAVEKKPGFGAKRQRLEAKLETPPPISHDLFPRAVAPGRVAIIGGGIAGACLAHSFARRGVAPILFDAGEGAASLSPAAMLMPRLERTDTPLARLHLAAYLHALDFYRGIDGAFAPIGVEQFPATDREPETFAALAADPPLPGDLLRASSEKLFHPRAGVLDPIAINTALLSGVDRRAVRVAKIERGSAWVLRDENGAVLAEAECVILACGPGLARFAQTAFLPLRYSRGQIDWAALDGAQAHALTAGGYAAPFAQGLAFGATFDRVEPDARVAPSAVSAEENLATLEGLSPDLARRIDRTKLQSRAAIRVSTPDVAPIAGLVPDAPAWSARFDPLRHGARVDLSSPAPAHDGLYVLGALGARGFLLAPLLAEEIVSECLGEPAMLDAEARAAVHPARVLARALKRGSAS